MKKLIHNDIQTIEGLLALVVVAHDKYAQRDFGFFTSLLEVLEGGFKFYDNKGTSDKSTQIKSLRSNLESINRGYHPYFFDKIEQNRRDTQYIVGLRILKESEALFLSDSHSLQAKLESVMPMIETIVLAFFQLQLFGEQDTGFYEQDAIERAWQQLSQDKNINLLQKKIILTTSYHDAIILISKFMNS